MSNAAEKLHYVANAVLLAFDGAFAREIPEAAIFGDAREVKPEHLNDMIDALSEAGYVQSSIDAMRRPTLRLTPKGAALAMSLCGV